MTENLRYSDTDTLEKYWDWSVKVHQQREKDTTKLEGGKSAHKFTIDEIQEHHTSFGNRDERHTRFLRDIAHLFNKK